MSSRVGPFGFFPPLFFSTFPSREICEKVYIPITSRNFFGNCLVELWSFRLFFSNFRERVFDFACPDSPKFPTHSHKEKRAEQKTSHPLVNPPTPRTEPLQFEQFERRVRADRPQSTSSSPACARGSRRARQTDWNCNSPRTPRSAKYPRVSPHFSISVRLAFRSVPLFLSTLSSPISSTHRTALFAQVVCRSSRVHPHPF